MITTSTKTATLYYFLLSLRISHKISLTRASAAVSTAVLMLLMVACDRTTRCPVRDQAPVPNNQQLPPGAKKIKHVVVIFQENRTPDNLFHDPVLIARGADISSSGTNSLGHTVALKPIALANDYDLDHSHRAFLDMCDCGKMDGADEVKVFCGKNASNCPSTDAPFAYVTPSEVQPYFQLAEQFTFGDRMFQTNQGPSFAAHQFIISGTSAPTSRSKLFAAENATRNAAGCTAPLWARVKLIDPAGDESLRQYPCFEHATLSDLLDAQGISWRYYTPSTPAIWTGPNAIKHICQPQAQNGHTTCTGSAWGNVTIPQTQVLTDIANNQLASVSWVIPSGAASDHALNNDGSGPSWVASIVNAIGNSPYWSDTAIIITWDDWGGWYDHVPPKIINSYEYGFRVPLIVASPYAKPGYVSHVTHDFGSVLKFTEQIYGLPTLGYADVAADDLSDCFDFNQQPLKFQAIRTSMRAEQFLNDHRPPTDPDDD